MRPFTETAKPEVSGTLLNCSLPVIPKDFWLETLVSEKPWVHDGDAKLSSSEEEESHIEHRDERKTRQTQNQPSETVEETGNPLASHWFW